MVDPRQRRPVTPDPVRVPWAGRGRLVVWGLVLLGVATTAYFVVRAMGESETEDRWDALWDIRKVREGRADASWIDRPTPSSIAEREEYIERLERFLPDAEKDPVVAAHVHATIANLRAEQVVASREGPFEARRRHYDGAIAHLRTLLEKHPDAPIARSAFAPPGYASEAHRLLATLEKDRAFDEKHALRDVEPDADPVVLLRTEAGDLRLRLYGTDAKQHAERFRQRICDGSLDGVRIFRRERGDRESTLRMGGATSRGDDLGDAARAAWNDPTVAPPIPDEPARDRIVHRRGVVTTWRESNDLDLDDPEQVLFVVRDSPALDHRRTPFAKVADDASLATLDRIFEQPVVADSPDALAVESKRPIQNHLVDPVRVVKALLYEKGALAACHDAAKVRETEKRLDTVKADEDRKAPAPPPVPPPPQAPPAGVAPPPPAAPPASPPETAPAPGAPPGDAPPAGMDAPR